MDRRGNGDRVAPRLHKLEDGHLGGGVLHRHPVRLEREVALAAPELLGGEIPDVAHEDLLSQRERPAEPRAGGGVSGVHALVERRDGLEFFGLKHMGIIAEAV